MNDLRFAVRQLLKSPGFTTVAALTLAVGIGANTAIFSLLNELLWRPLAVKNPGELQAVVLRNREGEPSGQVIPYPVYRDYVEEARGFSEIVAYAPVFTRARIGDRRIPIRPQVVSGNFFSALGVKPLLGRAFLPEEDQAPLRNPVVVLSHGFWQSQLDADPGVVGRQIALDDFIEGPKTYTIVGVAPAAFRGFESTTPALWLPAMMHAHFKKSQPVNFHLIGRLAPGFNLDQATASLDAATQGIHAKYKGDKIPGYHDDPAFESGQKVRLNPAGRGLWGPFQNQRDIWKATRLALGIGALVLLIGCGNVANLLLARAARRRREIAVRLSLGATRGRLARQMVVESLLLALVAAGAGLLLAQWGNQLLLTLRPDSVSLLVATHLDLRVILFTLTLSLGTGLLFGLAPALTAARGDLNSVLKDDSHTTIGRESRWSLRNGLVVGQMAFSLLLLLGAGLCLRSFDRLQRVDPGFDVRHLVSVPINLDEVGNAPPNPAVYYQELMARVAALPGVKSVTHSWSAPFTPGGQLGLEPRLIEGHTPKPGEKLPLDAELAGPAFFETLGIPFIEPSRDDLASRRRLLFVNEAFARKYWPGQSAVGKRVASHTVAGVVANSRFAEVWREPGPTTYLQLAEPFNHTRCNLLVRAEGDPQAVAALLRQEIRRFNPALNTSGIRTAQAAWEESLAPQRFTLALLGVFAAVALFLAAIGIHGVMSFVVSQRTREIGIRMALGAQRREVLALVVGQGMGLAITGTFLGLVAGLGFTRLISGLLFQVEPTDPVTFSLVAGLLLLTALGACLRPARQAANTDPMTALRSE